MHRKGFCAGLLLLMAGETGTVRLEWMEEEGEKSEL